MVLLVRAQPGTTSLTTTSEAIRRACIPSAARQQQHRQLHRYHHQQSHPTSIFSRPQKRARLQLPPHRCLGVQQRTFIDSLLKSALPSPPLRRLTHTRTLPYSSTSIFKAVSDVSGYPSFLPFTINSTVQERDSKGYPTRATLKVGYAKFGVEEVWESVVRCDPETGVVTARSGEKSGNSEGVFETLSTKWKIEDDGRGKGSKVKLDLDVKFRNPVYDQMFAQVEGQVVERMIRAFEARVRDLEVNSKDKQ